MSQSIASSLEMELREASEAYYSGNPKIADSEFDAKRKLLEDADPSNPFLAEVGAPPSGKIVKHKIPMGSLNNCNNEEEIRKWWSRNSVSDVVVQHKFDGLSLSLEYENGMLVRGATRGDGLKGEDQTENISRCGSADAIDSLKKPVTCSVRGEGLVFLEDFTPDKFPNREDPSKTESNPRNSAVGAVCKENSPRVQWVQVICYDFLNGIEFETELDKLRYMEELGLPIAEYHHCTTIDQVLEIYRETVNNRDKLPYMVDGLVIKINDLSRQKELGSHNGRPKGQTALKFPHLSGETRVTDIELTVGHSGNIIPTAKYEPLLLEGRTFTHALLDNFNFVRDAGVGIGSTVKVEIMGDIIPKITAVTRGGEAFEPPSHCPVCGAEAKWQGAYLKCTNSTGCPAQSIARINTWIKKNEIKFWGPARQKMLFEADLVRDPADLYKLSKNDLAGVVGAGNASIMMKELDKSRKIPLDRFIGSLAIPFLGRSNAKKFVEFGFTTLNSFLDTDRIRNLNVAGFKVKMLRAIAEGISRNRTLINKFLDLVEVLEPQTTEETGKEENVVGKSFCFTGFRLHGTEKERFEELGHTEKSGVSKNLDYLVAKDVGGGSSKIKKAGSLGIPILSIEQFKSML